MNDELAIDVRGMTKRFGKRIAVNNVDLQVPTGEICGFLGPNGSGKTTFIRMLCGLLRADAAAAPASATTSSRKAKPIKRQVGYMTQRFSFWEDLSIARESRLRRPHVRREKPKRGCRAKPRTPRSRRARRPTRRANCPADGSSASPWPPA